MNEPPLRSSPKTLPPSMGYSHLAEARGRLIYISGQVAETPEGTLVGTGDFVAQVEQVFKNLAVALHEANATFADVVKLTYFCDSSVDRALLQDMRRIRDRYIDSARPPASSFVFVSALVRKEWLIEIEAIVALDT